MLENDALSTAQQTSILFKAKTECGSERGKGMCVHTEAHTQTHKEPCGDQWAVDLWNLLLGYPDGFVPNGFPPHFQVIQMAFCLTWD